MLAQAACSWTKDSSESCLLYGGFSSNLERSRGAWNSPSALTSLFFPASKKAKMTDATSFLVLSSCQGCNLLRERRGWLKLMPPPNPGNIFEVKRPASGSQKLES